MQLLTASRKIVAYPPEGDPRREWLENAIAKYMMDLSGERDAGRYWKDLQKQFKAFGFSPEDVREGAVRVGIDPDKGTKTDWGVSEQKRRSQPPDLVSLDDEEDGDSEMAPFGSEPATAPGGKPIDPEKTAPGGKPSSPEDETSDWEPEEYFVLSDSGKTWLPSRPKTPDGTERLPGAKDREQLSRTRKIQNKGGEYDQGFKDGQRERQKVIEDWHKNKLMPNIDKLRRTVRKEGYKAAWDHWQKWWDNKAKPEINRQLADKVQRAQQRIHDLYNQPDYGWQPPGVGQQPQQAMPPVQRTPNSPMTPGL